MRGDWQRASDRDSRARVRSRCAGRVAARHRGLRKNGRRLTAAAPPRADVNHHRVDCGRRRGAVARRGRAAGHSERTSRDPTRSRCRRTLDAASDGRAGRSEAEVERASALCVGEHRFGLCDPTGRMAVHWRSPVVVCPIASARCYRWRGYECHIRRGLEPRLGRDGRRCEGGDLGGRRIRWRVDEPGTGRIHAPWDTPTLAVAGAKRERRVPSNVRACSGVSRWHPGRRGKPAPDRLQPLRTEWGESPEPFHRTARFLTVGSGSTAGMA